MGKSLDRFFNFIKQIDKIDIYGHKISLKFMKESEYKTRFGGLITLIVGLLTGLWTLVSIYQLIYSQVISIITQEYVMDVQQLNSISFSPKSQNTFQIGYFNKHTQQLINQSYFKFVSYYDQECDITNSKVEVKSFQKIQSQQVELIDCQDLVESYQEYQYLSKTKEGYFCFNKDQQFPEQEIYPEVQQTFNCRRNINILLTKNKNLDKQVFQNLIENSTLSLSIPTTLIDYTNIQNPFEYINVLKQFDTNQIFSAESNYQQKLMVQINLQEVVIEDERNYSIQQNREMNSFTIQSISDKVKYFLFCLKHYQILKIKLINRAINAQEQSELKNSINESDVLFKIKIGFSELNYNKRFIRSFQSIPSILGSLGGGIKIVVLMGFLIVSPLCQIHFQKTMLNEVFNFENDQDDDNINNLNLHSLKSLDGIQTNNKNHASIINNSNTSQAQNQDIPPKKQQVSRGLLKFNNLENQNIMQTTSPKYIQVLRNATSFIQMQGNFQKQENLPTSTLSITNIKPIKNIEKPKKKQINQIANNYVHQNSIIFSKHSLQQENNNEELNFTQLSQLKGGERKNKMKEIIKGTIFINSQRQIGSQQNLDSNCPFPKLPQGLSFLLNAQSQNAIALTKKKQNDQKKAEEQIFEKYFKTTFNPLKISFIQSLFYYIWPFGKFKRTKEQMSYSIDKLNYHLDSIYIIKKLLEIDKLKMLLLDENQIKLLEFLPKPTINLKNIENQQNSCQISSHLITEDGQKKINILYQDTRNELTKATQAFQAFQTIKAKTSLTQIDRKLIDLLDPKIADYFNQDSDENKSQMIPANQMSQENENNQLNVNYDKEVSNKNQYNYQFQENTAPQSQNLIKEIYQKSKGSSGYISSPLEIYRSAAKKASMFKQPQTAMKRGSLHVTSQSNRYDEVEEYQKNSQIQIKHIQSDGQSEQNIGTRLTRVKSYSSEDIIKQRRSQESSVSSQQNKEGSSFYFGVKNISAQYPKSLEMQYVLDDSHMQQDIINGNMEESQIKLDQNLKVFQELKNETDNSNTVKKIFSNSIISSCSHSHIADESIKLQNIDCHNLQKFTYQNKFFNSSNLFASQIQKQAQNQSEYIYSSSEQTDLQQKKNSLIEENKQVSQYEIKINLQKKQSLENLG